MNCWQEDMTSLDFSFKLDFVILLFEHFGSASGSQPSVNMPWWVELTGRLLPPQGSPSKPEDA
jgi:hypothetical protein